MATNDANQPALGRQYALQVVHTLRVNIDHTMNGGIVGILPKGAFIIDGAVHVIEGFDDTTADDINVGEGTIGDDEFVSAADANSAATVLFSAEDLDTSNRYSADERVVTWGYNAAATGDGKAGQAVITVWYVVDNG